MRIIKRGILPSEMLYRTKCNNCGTQYEFKQSEGSITYDRNDYLIVSLCPLCNKQVFTACN